MLTTSGATSLVLLFVFIVLMLALATPATSVALGNSETSGNTSISNSVSLEKPQDLSIATILAAPPPSSSSAPITSKEQATTKLPLKNAWISVASLAQSSSSLQAISAFPPPIYAWGHVTKYSRILYDESVVIKGPIMLDVKYPEIDNSNSFTITGIQAYANDDVTTSDAADLDTGHPNQNSYLQVYPVRGGIGYNSTVIRFSLNSKRELHYTLVIHGVDV